MNPIAGIGGAVGLKGSDGEETVKKAIALGAKPVAPRRARLFLEELSKLRCKFRLYVGAGAMGEDEAAGCGLKPSLIVGERKEATTAEDTKEAAAFMASEKVDLLVFCGGDGTARDVMDAVGLRIPALGIPAGVKVYSGVFAKNPKVGARIVKEYLEGALPLIEAEVMDVDEEAFRRGRLSAKLYGYLKIPAESSLVQWVKAPTPQTESEKENQRAISKYVIEEMEDECAYVVGPGSTTKAIFDELGLEKTLLGVDVLYGGRIAVKDANEKQILEILKGAPRAKIIVTPIGGQGYIFGRGNQQISPEVIRRVGKGNIIVVATKHKLQTLRHGSLLVDTGDPKLDRELRGYIRVVTDYREERIVKVE